MNIKNWLSSFFTKSHPEVSLPYVTGNTFRTWDTSSVSSPYKQIGTVRRSIDIMSFNLAQLPFNIVKDGVKLSTTTEDPNNVQVGSLFQHPNEFMSGFKFKLIHWSYFLLYDKVYWLLSRNLFGVIKGIYVINPSVVETKIKDGVVEYYKYNNVKVLPEDMICFSGFDPANIQGLGGSSILETIKTEYETDKSAATYGKKVFENGTRLSGVIEIDKEAATNDAEMKKVLTQWNAAHQGEKNSHKVGILSPGMHYIERGMSMRDAEYIDGRKEIKERIIEAYGIPKSVYGLVDKIDRATADTQMRQFWQVTLKPLAIMLQEDINTLFLPKNYPNIEVKCDFTVVEELKKDLNETADAARKYFELGYSRNEINDRFKLDMEEEESGDIRYIPTSLIPVDEPLDMIPEPEKRISLDSIIDKGKAIEKSRNNFRAQFLRTQRIQEKRFNSKLKRYLFEYRKEIINILTNKKTDIDLTTILNSLSILKAKQDTKLEKMFTPLYSDASLASVKGDYDLLKIDKKPEPNAVVVRESLNRIKGINNTITKKLKTEISLGVDSGESIDEIAKRVRGVYNFTTSRSKVIARTESANIMSATSLKTYDTEGIKYKSWLSAGDDLVRSEHVQNASQGAIPINEPFSSGEFYPNSVNCRCSIAPEFKQ